MFIHTHTLDLSRINYAAIILLPKSPDDDTIQKHRPICLLEVLFNIFSKVVTLRVEMTMGKVIAHY